MPLLLWDASALAKRYTPELGYAVVDELFHHVPRSEHVLTLLGYAETFAVIRRASNRGRITTSAFRTAVSSLRSDFIDSPDANMLHISEPATLAGIALIERHNLNASDASILTTYLYFQARRGGEKCVLISADMRFIRAAQSEGLATINPEQVTLPVSSLLAQI